MFYFHLANLPPSSLGRRILEEQRTLEMEGTLASHGRMFLAQLNIRESLVKVMTKKQWKTLICSKIVEKNKSELIQMSKGYWKMNYLEMQKESFEIKEFLQTLRLSQARTMYLIKTDMIDAPMNFMGQPDYAKSNWQCECGLQFTTQHYKVCIKYEKERTNIDWENNEHIAKYFQRVIKLRVIEEENKSNTKGLGHLL